MRNEIYELLLVRDLFSGLWPFGDLGEGMEGDKSGNVISDDREAEDGNYFPADSYDI